jgi:diol dehydratase reactivase alpha subunit
MKFIAGVDIGNSTTEVCIASETNGIIEFISSGITKTTGIKGTTENTKGIISALNNALDKAEKKILDLSLIRINEATPVIGRSAMETITETIITESTMIGHNPSTPGGVGLGIGQTINIHDIKKCSQNKSYIVLIPEHINYDKAANVINEVLGNGINITAAIVQNDEGVLINNRILKKMPVVDEVKYIDKVPLNCEAAVEVADTGQTIKTLSNPYGIASIFNFNSDETKQVIPIAKSLIGIRSAVVIKTPKGEVKERVIPAGVLCITCDKSIEKVDIDCGAEEIMNLVSKIEKIEDVNGEPGTNIGGMISTIKSSMAKLTGENIKDIRIKDILAVDTTLPVKVTGGIAGETFMEKAVAIAAMVQTKRLPMEKVANRLKEETGIYVKIGGIEAIMAVLGAFTTPGVKLPLAILDLGGGSTDAAIMDEKGMVKSIHLSGAGELVTMLINSELGLNDRNTAELIKTHTVGRVESLFHIKLETGEVKFFDKPLEAKLYKRVVVLSSELIPIYSDATLEKIVHIRRSAKKRVFVENTLRALKTIAPMNNIRNVPNIVMVGGSAEDFEIPEMILSELSKYKIVAGRGNIRKVEGPRNAVATGLVMSYVNDKYL